jgi:O-antigen ligase
VHLVLLGGVLAVAVFADGGTAPQAWLACELAVGLLLACWALTGEGPRTPASLRRGFPLALAALPLYAALQSVPLPLALVRLLSPARAELHKSVSGVLPHVPSWAPLSVSPQATLSFALRLGAYAAAYWIVRGLGPRFGRQRFAVAAPLVLLAAAQASIALLQSLAGESAAGSYVNRNHLAGFLEMALPFAVVPAIAALPALVPVLSGFPAPAACGGKHAGGRRRVWAAAVGGVLAAAAAVLILAAIVTTRSRGGLIAALLSLLVVGLGALKRSTHPRKKWLLAAALPALLAAAFLYLPSEDLVRRYTHLLGGEALRREGRVLLWAETLDLIAAYPLAGCGFGGFEPAFLRYKNSAPMVNDRHAHNDYLELAAEAGLAGFVLCVLLAIRPIGAAVRRGLHAEAGQDRWMAVACAGSLAAIFVHSLVDFNLRIPANGMVFFWVLGLCPGESPKRHPKPGVAEPAG